jgi:hypothetical protein
MNYFDYAKVLKVNNPYRSWMIYEVMYKSKLTNYAGKIYGSGAADALDNAFQQLLLYYDENKGDLVHYATSVLGKIDLNKGRKEIPDSEVQSLMSDAKSYESEYGNPCSQVLSQMEEMDESKAISVCIDELLPLFLIDFKFFKSKKVTDKLLDYDAFYLKYSQKVFIESLNTIINLYADQVELLYKIKGKVPFRPSNTDKYTKALDESIDVIGEKNGVVVYKKNNKLKVGKRFYCVNLKGIVEDLILRYYNSSSGIIFGVLLGTQHIGYCSLSGKITSSLEELKGYLEEEVVNYILSRLPSIHITNHVKGERLYIVVSRELVNSSICMMIGEDALTYEFMETPSKMVI